MSVAIPTPVQPQALCAGALAYPSGRPQRRNLAVPTTTMAQASNLVSFLPVGASKQNLPRGGGWEEEQNVASKRSRNNSPARSVKIGKQN